MYSSTTIAGMTDDELVAALRECGERRREIEAATARLSAEVKIRSDRELGYSGLAQRKGARTPEILVQQLTGLSRAGSAAIVRVGSQPEFLDAVKPEAIGADKADALGRGLGEVTEGVSADALRSVAERLARDAEVLTVEEVAARARAERDALDAANIEGRERDQRDQRYLTLTPRLDGMYRISGLTDLEGAMVLKSATDAIIAPRRGGPRFVDPAKAAEQERIAAADQRTLPQMALDALIDLVQLAVATPAGAALTGGKGHVTIHTLRSQDDTVGAGYFEGGIDAVSAATLERYLCDTSYGVVGFEAGLPVDSSSDQRLFNRRQRRALAAMWGGCAFPGCDRPPSFTEAHHIRPWATGHHKTETADGVLLCRHHHMLIHNNGWSITRVGIEYTLHAPDGATFPLMPKSPVYRQHRGGGRDAPRALISHPALAPTG